MKTCRIQHVCNDSYFRVPCDDPADAWGVLMQEPGENGPPGLKTEDGLSLQEYVITSGEEGHTVGSLFRGMDGVYRCTSYDSRQGFWMRNETDPSDWRNVSERAIGRTYHKIPT